MVIIDWFDVWLSVDDWVEVFDVLDFDMLHNEVREQI